MRIAIGALIVLAIPGLAFGWLSTVPPELHGPSDWDRSVAPDPASATIVFVAGGLALAVLGSVLVTVGDLARAFRSASTSTLGRSRPIAWPIVVLSVLAAFGTLSVADVHLDRAEAIGVWAEVVLTTAIGFGVVLSAVVLVRSLVGLWSLAALRMWPGRRTAAALLVLAALAATPVAHGPPSHAGLPAPAATMLVPMAEKMRLEISRDHSGWPAWRYHGH